MADKPDTSAEIKETDIVFDCPFCGKSLAIDYRGAGLSIPCSDCGKDVDVPIPEGMELSDIDGSEEEQETRILNLRKALSQAELKIAELESRVAELALGNENLGKRRSADDKRQVVVKDSIADIKQAAVSISRAVGRIEDGRA